MAPKRNKSGLHPARYELLSQDERAQVRAAHKTYNEAHPESPYFEVIDFYHNVYRQPKSNPLINGTSAALGILGAFAVAGGSCLVGNLFFAASNPPLIAQFWANGGSARVLQFCIFEGLALAGLVLQLGGIV